MVYINSILKNMQTTSEILNVLMSDKSLGKYNLLRVIIPNISGVRTVADVIPAVKSWLGVENVELIITLDNIQIDTTTNIYQHYSRRVMNIKTRKLGVSLDESLDEQTFQTTNDTENTNYNCVDVLNRPVGKNALFNVTKDDINIATYAMNTFRKYEHVIVNVLVDNRHNMFVPIKHNPILHVHMPEKERTLNEKYLEYRFNLLEFGKTSAYIFVRQMLAPYSATNPNNPNNPNNTINNANNNLVMGLEFTIDEKEFVSDARLAMIIKYISGYQILLNSIY